MEREKHDNYNQVCGTDVVTLPIRKTIEERLTRALELVVQPVEAAGCEVSPNYVRNPDNSKGCSVNINAYPMTVPEGGGEVTVCWRASISWGDKPFTVQPFGISGRILSGSRTTFVDTDTTFTYTSRNERKNHYPRCVDTVTVTVEEPPPPPDPGTPPNLQSEPEPEVPGLRDWFARVELVE